MSYKTAGKVPYVETVRHYLKLLFLLIRFLIIDFIE